MAGKYDPRVYPAHAAIEQGMRRMPALHQDASPAALKGHAPIPFRVDHRTALARYGAGKKLPRPSGRLID